MRKSIVISSGHGSKVAGAVGYIDEVTEARRVAFRVAEILEMNGVQVELFNDDISTTQQQNLEAIVAFHNSFTRELDVSVHFNCYETTDQPRGTECLYYSADVAAAQVVEAIAGCGLVDRGHKRRTDLYFLNNTEMPAILIEVCFVDSEADVEVYLREFDAICAAIAWALIDNDEGDDDGGQELLPPVFTTKGRASTFGGPDDTGVSASEGLAFIDDVEQAPQLFLPYQPEGTTGLARRLNPYVNYVACRWDYDVTPKSMLRASGLRALVHAPSTGVSLLAFPADWGPHEDTHRVADLSPGLMEALGIHTDDEVMVNYPYAEDPS